MEVNLTNRECSYIKWTLCVCSGILSSCSTKLPLQWFGIDAWIGLNSFASNLPLQWSDGSACSGELNLDRLAPSNMPLQWFDDTMAAHAANSEEFTQTILAKIEEWSQDDPCDCKVMSQYTLVSVTWGAHGNLKCAPVISRMPGVSLIDVHLQMQVPWINHPSHRCANTASTMIVAFAI